MLLGEDLLDHPVQHLADQIHGAEVHPDPPGQFGDRDVSGIQAQDGGAPEDHLFEKAINARHGQVTLLVRISFKY